MIFRQLTSKSLHSRATQRSKEFENFHCSSNGRQLFDKDTCLPKKEVSDRVSYLPKKNLFDGVTHPEFLPFQHDKVTYLPQKKMVDEVTHPEFLPFQHSMLVYSRSNNHREVLRIFKKQLQCDFINAINAVSLAVALKACRGEPKLGHHIHGVSIASRLVSNLSVSNALMSMYCKSGQFNQALSIFEKLKNPDIVSCNTVLSGFENIGDTLEFTRQMNLTGMIFDAVTYSTVLARCADNEEFLFGIQLHSLELKCGLGCEVFIGNALITMYCKWGHIVEAERVFDEMPKKDLVSWNAMLSGYAQEGNYGRKAIWACLEMVRRVMKLDHVSLTSIVSVCGQERNLELGKQIHGLAIKRGYAARRDYVNHVSVCNVLMSLYAKCEAANDAALVFESMTDRNVISWTTMISTDEENAMSLFNGMRLDGVYPNEVTFIALIHAITINYLVENGRPVHGFCLKFNFLSKLDVANSLITMYAEFKSMEDSEKIFEELKYRGTVSWNALISGYSQNGMGQEALQTFCLAILESLPNEFTIGSILSAVGATEAISLKHGQRCHSYLIKLGLNDPVVLGALLDMYAKRGSISESLGVFHEMPERSQVAWTAIISAYARHGDYESVMSLFEEMEKRGVRPDSITFLSLLTACSRKGMVDMGKQMFDSMVKNHLIEPSGLHYSCMVDMLGRAGRLKEAEELVGQIPGGPGFSVLQSLLGASRIYGNVEMGKRAADALMELKPEESGSYVLMSNLYAERGDWEKVARIRRGMRDRGVRKEVGFSWVDAGEANGSLPLHGFSSDDKSHPKTEEIYMMAEYVGLEMKFLQRERERRGESL